MKICTVIGARPQFVKAAVVSRAIRNHQKTNAQRGPEDIQEVIVHTGQHFDNNMSDVFFNELNIPEPKYNLGIGGGTHGENTGRMLEAVERVLLSERPAWVLVYGDTDSTLAGALAAVKLHIPVAHVEAGLRSFNRQMPEEINRILTDHCSSLLFTTSETATQNLIREGIPNSRAQQVGDVMYDAALIFAESAEKQSRVLEKLNLDQGSFVLVTIHRAENTDSVERLGEILEGLGSCERKIVWPIHPRTRKKIEELGLIVPRNILAVDPVGFLDMIQLERTAAVIVTDSGGVQKEAYFHGVPCITLRDETEWVETVAAGWNRLVPARNSEISLAINMAAKPVDANCNLYGDGKAAERIVDIFREQAHY